MTFLFKKITQFLLLIILLITLKINAQQNDSTKLPFAIAKEKRLPDDELAEKKEGIYVTGVPDLSSDPVNGFGAGAEGSLFFNGKKKDPFFEYTPYRAELNVALFITTRLQKEAKLGLDVPYIFNTKWRLRAEAAYEINPNLLNNIKFDGKKTDSGDEIKRKSSNFIRLARSQSRTLSLKKSNLKLNNVIQRKKSLFLTQKMKMTSLFPNPEDLGSSFDFRHKARSSMLHRHKTLGAPLRKNMLIHLRNNPERNLIQEKKESKAFISEISSSVKMNVKQNLHIEKNPKKYILREVKNLIQRHIESEKKEFFEMIDRLDKIYDGIVKETVNKNINS